MDTDHDHPNDFKRISRQYSDASILMHEGIARKAGLSGTDHKYLGLLIQHGPMTAGELAKITGLTTGAVTGLVDRLEKKRFVKREFNNDDRRKVFIVPNKQKILKTLEPLFKDLQEKTARLISSFSKEEIRTIEKYFTSAIHIMHETTESLNKKKK